MPEAKTLPLDLIDPPERVLRNDISETEIAELALSIQANGLLQPIVVVPRLGRYRLVAGHRRYLAHRFFGALSIDCRVFETAADAELAASAAENIQRRDLSAVEEAQAVRAMIDARGMSVRDAARSLGKSEAWIRTRVEILLWPEQFVALIHKGALSVAVARELVAVEDETIRNHYLKCALESGVSAQCARQWRMDWEAQRPMDGSAAAVVEAGTPPIAVFVPERQCVVCDTAHPVTSVQFLAVCLGCCRTLQEAKAGGGEAA